VFLEKPKAIIFNCNFNGLSIIQELGIHNIECVAMDCLRSIGTYSRYSKFVRCPDPSRDESQFVDFLYDYCGSLASKPVLIPTNDHWATAVSKQKERLQEVSIPCVSDWPATRLLVDKRRFYEEGMKHNYMTPRTWREDDLLEIPDEDFPIVAKPVFRRNSSDEDITNLLENMDRLRLVVLKSKKELCAFLQKEKAYVKHLVFQEFVNGMSDEMHTVGIYADNNNDIQGLFAGKKIRGYPADIGDCIVGKACRVPELLIENTIRIVKEIGYSGIAEFEYKRDTKTKAYKLIEVNPRSWSWIGITPASGVSLPLIAYNDLCGLPYNRALINQNIEVVYEKMLPDLINSLFRYKKTYPSWHKSLKEWLLEQRTFKKKGNLIKAEFNAKDYPVAIMSYVQITKTIAGKLLRLMRKRS